MSEKIGRYVQFLLDNRRLKAHSSSSSMLTPMSFVMLLFLDLLSVFDESMKKRTVKVAHSYTAGNMTRPRLQFVRKAQENLLGERYKKQFPRPLALYMWHGQRSDRFVTLSKRSVRLSSLHHPETIRVVEATLKIREGINGSAYRI